MLVIIPHHTGNLINLCLESIEKSFRVGLNIKVVVVSSENRLFPHATNLVSTEGPALKRNLAFNAYCKKEFKYVVFLDDDVELSPYCLTILVDEMESRPKVGMGFCKILNMERRDEFDDCGSWLTPTGFLWARAGNGVRDTGQYDQPTPCLASKSATCIVRREAFLEAGGFDPHYYILGEETDLAWRIWLQGWECWYFPWAKSWHAFNTKFKPKAKHYTEERIFLCGPKNYLNLLLTNLPTSRLWWVLPVHTTMWIVSAAGFLLQGHTTRSCLILKGIWLNLTGIRKTLRKRRMVQGTKKVRHQDIWTKISHAPSYSYYMGRLSSYIRQGLHG